MKVGLFIPQYQHYLPIQIIYITMSCQFRPVEQRDEIVTEILIQSYQSTARNPGLSCWQLKIQAVEWHGD